MSLRFTHSLFGLAFLFLLFPSMIARSEHPLIVGHRGASFDAPENTLAAFLLAWQMEADAIEGDFYLTSDRQIVCIHDADTRRICGRDLKVESSTLDELRQLDAGRWKDPKFVGEKLPTFSEVLSCVPPGKRFVIELKSKTKIVPVLVEEIIKADRKDISLLIISFDAQTIKRCKQLLPDVKAHWLTDFDEMIGNSVHPTAKEIAKTVHEIKADGVGMQARREHIDASFVEQLREDGCQEFHVWTVDEPQDAMHFARLGAIGITTNRPDLIRRALSLNSDQP
jgi:glycerophosphoryl diester phosphodiesterase